MRKQDHIARLKDIPLFCFMHKGPDPVICFTDQRFHLTETVLYSEKETGMPVKGNEPVSISMYIRARWNRRPWLSPC